MYVYSMHCHDKESQGEENMRDIEESQDGEMGIQ